MHTKAVKGFKDEQSKASRTDPSKEGAFGKVMMADFFRHRINPTPLARLTPAPTPAAAPGALTSFLSSFSLTSGEERVPHMVGEGKGEAGFAQQQAALDALHRKENAENNPSAVGGNF